jgi:hypothetical protein
VALQCDDTVTRIIKALIYNGFAVCGSGIINNGHL